MTSNNLRGTFRENSPKFTKLSFSLKIINETCCKSSYWGRYSVPNHFCSFYLVISNQSLSVERVLCRARDHDLWSINIQNYFFVYSFFRLGDTVAFPMKEEFAKLCFETLLEFSFFKETDNKGRWQTAECFNHKFRISSFYLPTFCQYLSTPIDNVVLVFY